MNHRTLQNGDIVFPQRGKPPNQIPNYTRDPKDPYVFHPDFVPCQRRTVSSWTAPCGKVHCNWFCEKFGKIVNPPDCEMCESPEP